MKSNDQTKYSTLVNNSRNMDIASEIKSDLSNAIRGLEVLCYINDVENVIPSKRHARVLEFLSKQIVMLEEVKEAMG